jgi:hypothetical protein
VLAIGDDLEPERFGRGDTAVALVKRIGFVGGDESHFFLTALP